MRLARVIFALAMALVVAAPALQQANAQGGNALYSINLSTGSATFIGTVGQGQAIRGLAVNSRGSAGVALTTNNSLVLFNLGSPAARSNLAITGLASGETIVGIDYRPANQALTALSDFGNLYRIDARTGAALYLSTLDVALESAVVGFDFNPTVDRLRIATSSGQNLRVNVDTGVATVDGRLAYAVGDANAGVTPSIVGSGYANSFRGATATTLYGIDGATGNLVTQAPPNDGVLNTVGPLGVGVGSLTGFDLTPGNVAYAIFS